MTTTEEIIRTTYNHQLNLDAIGRVVMRLTQYAVSNTDVEGMKDDEGISVIFNSRALMLPRDEASEELCPEIMGLYIEELLGVRGGEKTVGQAIAALWRVANESSVKNG